MLCKPGFVSRLKCLIKTANRETPSESKKF